MQSFLLAYNRIEQIGHMEICSMCEICCVGVLSGRAEQMWECLGNVCHTEGTFACWWHASASSSVFLS